jgi:hypothetical protein
VPKNRSDDALVRKHKAEGHEEPEAGDGKAKSAQNQTLQNALDCSPHPTWLR